MRRVEISIPENLFESEFISKNKPFSKIEAYIFLKINGIYSINFLAQKFLWSNPDTKKFLMDIEKIDFPKFIGTKK